MNKRKCTQQYKQILYNDIEGRGCLTVMKLKSDGSES